MRHRAFDGFMQAIIVDERFNRGGQVADYYIDLLRRPLISYWNTRYGDDFKAPLGGYKQSGNGREWGAHGIEDFLEVKAVMGTH